MGLHVQEDFVELGAASAMSAVVLCLLFAVVCALNGRMSVMRVYSTV